MDDLMRKLPIGIQTFEDIRRKNYLYVDKTALVWRMANLGKPYFLSRPRRFGKSLLLSTFKAYFQGKKELFEGLAIEKLETEWNEYPVLHLDLNAEKYDKPEKLKEILSSHLTQWEIQYGKGMDENTLSRRFEGIIRRAYEQTGSQVAVLRAVAGKYILCIVEMHRIDRCYSPCKVKCIRQVIGLRTSGGSYIPVRFLVRASERQARLEPWAWGEVSVE